MSCDSPIEDNYKKCPLFFLDDNTFIFKKKKLTFLEIYKNKKLNEWVSKTKPIYGEVYDTEDGFIDDDTNLVLEAANKKYEMLYHYIIKRNKLITPVYN